MVAKEMYGLAATLIFFRTSKYTKALFLKQSRLVGWLESVKNEGSPVVGSTYYGGHCYLIFPPWEDTVGFRSNEINKERL